MWHPAHSLVQGATFMHDQSHHRSYGQSSGQDPGRHRRRPLDPLRHFRRLAADLAGQEVQRDDAGLAHQVMAGRGAFMAGRPEVP